MTESERGVPTVTLIEKVNLPSVKFFMVTWGLSGEFGGMTTMCLTRSRTMLELAGVVAPVLTFDFRPDDDEITSSLRDHGHVIEGMSVLNIYQYYRRLNLTGWEVHGEQTGLEPLEPSVDVQKQSIDDANGDVFCRITRSLDNEIEYRKEYRRPDGSTFLLDEAVADDTGTSGGRLVSLLNEDGQIVRQYLGLREFYRGWLAELAGDTPSTFIADSVQTINILGGIESDNIMTLMVLHNSHIAQGGDPLRGKLTPSRRSLVTDSRLWDGLLFLTEKHRQDFIERFGGPDNLFRLPNPSPRAPSLPPFSQREPGRGVMVCRLEAVKNVHAAIDIIDIARRSVPDVRLDIYGDGKKRYELQQRIVDLQLGDNIKLHGHIPKAFQEFSTARFSLLTSRQEGQPLVLLESLGLGCPPVAFDIRYGPEDVIDDAVNGFLAAAGDVEAAAGSIVKLCTDHSLAETMSARAWEESEKFGYAAVLERLGTIVQQAWDQKHQRLFVDRMAFRVDRLALVESGHIQVAGRLTWDQTAGEPAEDLLSANLQIVPRHDGAAQTFPGDVLAKAEGLLELEFSAGADTLGRDISADDLLDAFVVVSGRNVLYRQRLKFVPQAGQWLPYPTLNGKLSFRPVSQPTTKRK